MSHGAELPDGELPPSQTYPLLLKNRGREPEDLEYFCSQNKRRKEKQAAGTERTKSKDLFTIRLKDLHGSLSRVKNCLPDSSIKQARIKEVG